MKLARYFLLAYITYHNISLQGAVEELQFQALPRLSVLSGEPLNQALLAMLQPGVEEGIVDKVAIEKNVPIVRSLLLSQLQSQYIREFQTFKKDSGSDSLEQHKIAALLASYHTTFASIVGEKFSPWRLRTWGGIRCAGRCVLWGESYYSKAWRAAREAVGDKAHNAVMDIKENFSTLLYPEDLLLICWYAKRPAMRLRQKAYLAALQALIYQQIDMSPWSRFLEKTQQDTELSKNPYSHFLRTVVEVSFPAKNGQWI